MSKLDRLDTAPLDEAEATLARAMKAAGYVDTECAECGDSFLLHRSAIGKLGSNLCDECERRSWDWAGEDA